MPKRPKTYHRPDNLDDALSLLAKPGYFALGGGAHMLATEEGLDAEAVVDLQGCGLGHITYGPQTGFLEVGAMTRLIDLWDYLRDNTLPEGLPQLIQQSAHQAGPNTYRNAATLGGVIASRLPDSELLAALLVAEASLALRLPQAETVSLNAYLDAYTRPAGLITAVHVLIQPGKTAAARVARTPADYPIVSVTGWLPAGQPARLSATGIADRPIRLNHSEDVVTTVLDDAAIDAAATAAQDAATHPGDFRGSAAYRAEMATVLTRRILRELADS